MLHLDIGCCWGQSSSRRAQSVARRHWACQSGSHWLDVTPGHRLLLGPVIFKEGTVCGVQWSSVLWFWCVVLVLESTPWCHVDKTVLWAHHNMTCHSTPEGHKLWQSLVLKKDCGLTTCRESIWVKSCMSHQHSHSRPRDSPGHAVQVLQFDHAAGLLSL